MEIRLTELAAGMEFGTVVAWLKQPGDSVQAGEPIVEVEAEKASHEIEAPVSGRLVEVSAATGDEIAVGGLLAVIDPG